MNYPIAAACGLTVLAFVAHMTGGIRQSLSIEPRKVAGESVSQIKLKALDRNWVQTMCAFQLVSVDLLALSIALYLLAFKNVLSPAQPIAWSLAIVYLFWGLSWLVQLLALKRKPIDYLFLGHWSFWFLCSGLIYWGSLSL
jgi:heme/copper-type cytochrome/quinol oxidase subunit 4